MAKQYRRQAKPSKLPIQAAIAMTSFILGSGLLALSAAFGAAAYITFIQ